jgi:hypothetical protein
MSQRSELHLRARPHHHPDRAGEPIVEVWRNGAHVATIYGTREGVQIVSEYITGDGRNVAFFFEAAEMPSYVIPLLAPDETCPWCEGKKLIRLHGTEIRYCPVCSQQPFAEKK